MSTVYTVSCVSGANEVNLKIQDSINPLPGSDTWSTLDISSWGIDGGTVAGWGTTDLNLHGVGAAPVAILYGFVKSVSKGDTGKGEKQYPDGTFPSGTFDWTCTEKE
jgi:hypothetical protein